MLACFLLIYQPTNNRSLAANDLFVFFTGTGKAEYAGGPPQVVTGPVYLDAYPLVGILGASFPFIGIAYVRTLIVAIG